MEPISYCVSFSKKYEDPYVYFLRKTCAVFYFVIYLSQIYGCRAPGCTPGQTAMQAYLVSKTYSQCVYEEKERDILKKRKLAALFASTLLIAAVALTGCGGNKDAQQADQPAADAEKITIVFSHNQPVDSPEGIGAQAMVDKLYELLGEDRVSVELYPAQQKGNLREQAEATQIGDINITMQPVSTITPFVDDIKVIDFPYLLPADREQIFEVLDGELGQEALGRLEQGGFKGLGFWFEGYKLFTTNGKEIHSPADFQGMKIRIMESPLLKAQYENWGATATPIAYSELYSALEQGTVDGEENPIQTIVLNNYQEVQSQIIQSYHGTMTYILMANLDWFNNLPEDVQAAVIEAEAYGRQETRKAYAEKEQEYLDVVKNAEGVHYYELTPEEIEAFKATVQPVYDSQTAGSEWQADFVQRLQEAFAAL